MIDNLQPEVAVAFDEGRPDIGDIRTPLSTEDAKHDIIYLVVLQPAELLEPVRAEATGLSRGAPRDRLTV